MAVKAEKAFESMSKPSPFDQEGHVYGSAGPAVFLRRLAWQDAVSRAFDIFGALVLIVLLLPALALSSFVVLVMTGRPVFIRQRRVGRGGSLFWMYKIRTMVPNADKLKHQVAHLNMMSGPFFKAQKDPRITPPGRVIRQLSFDEIPQLLNILMGDMSLVGPRPMLPDEVLQLDCHDILSVKPGLTGLWQISGRSLVTDSQEKLSLDRQYIRGKCLSLDIRILLRTVVVFLWPKGAF